ncbi:Protein of unknown function [Pseudobutyrivibrio sp. 49]|uniref:DUF2974 domain-containing protein n=1 Tax=unclassified Pseudobutyrivibrio TaxID=2638619 RepID=UPI00088E118E|nr:MULTISPECIES: DUF2974 domain-containing protein [unclassified Pseudobutyrivibrio]SDH41808.1 Protein of unknown function [Pseudobutyrivibrio sp. 49]SFN45358.1 Protein of unknown function [Pseudobutyrivibrio sp. UC1225]
MANIEDYLIWRGDVPFDIDPFNEVDNAVLCELVYTAFDGIVPGPGLKEKISIEDACDLFFEKHSENELLARTSLTKRAPFLIREMAHSKRFGGMKLSGFVNELDAEEQSQFAVCTFYLPDGTIYVAFRGTDDSLIGWKEDFNMSFSPGTGGQLKAVEYLNKNFARTMKQLRIGGHSKGGSFALYGSAFCKPHIKDNIIEIYNNDGPGFIPEILKTPEYKSVIKRVHKYIPNESIIGMMMYTKAKISVVSSNTKGLSQHDLFSWQVVRNRFTKVDSVANSSVMIDEIMKEWTKKFDYETREAFGDVFFELLSNSGATKMSHITGNKVKSIAIVTKEIQELDPENQAIVIDVLKHLMAVGGDTLKNTVLSKLPKMQK